MQNDALTMLKYLLLFLLLPIFVTAQNDTLGDQLQNQTDYQIHIKKAKTPIKLDGVLDEKDWKTALCPLPNMCLPIAILNMILTNAKS